MKLREVERHLRAHGCVLFREGGAHRVWLNPSNRKIASVPHTVKSKKEPSVAFVSSLKSRSRRHVGTRIANGPYPKFSWSLSLT
jgi:predicted RNA binding protein YcfA (HicA-like mRNA interferase family)